MGRLADGRDRELTLVVDLQHRVKEPEGEQGLLHGSGGPRQEVARRQQVALVPAIKCGLCLGRGAVEGHNAGGDIATAKLCTVSTDDVNSLATSATATAAGT